MNGDEYRAGWKTKVISLLFLVSAEQDFLPCLVGSPGSASDLRFADVWTKPNF